MALREPRRIVSVCPSNTEILHALGLLERVVGVDEDSDWPPEVATKERVGLDLRIDADKVASLEPDLVVASLSVPGMEKVVANLEARKLPVLVLDARRLPAIYDDIRLVGEHTGRQREAAEVVRGMQDRIGAVAARWRDAPRLRLYLEWWPRPYIVPARDSWFNDMAAAVNAVNVFEDKPGASTPVSEEEILAADPDHVLLCWCGTLQRKQHPDKVHERPSWRGMRAVQEGRVAALDEGLFGRNGPRVVEGVEVLERVVRLR